MALDEPKEEDRKVELENLTFVMGPDVAQIADQSGGVVIDYVDDGYRKGYTVQLGTQAGGCGDCSCG